MPDTPDLITAFEQATGTPHAQWCPHTWTAADDAMDYYAADEPPSPSELAHAERAHEDQLRRDWPMSGCGAA